MCGIGGKLSFETKPGVDVAERMADSMQNRGPDAGGVYSNGKVVLAHRRLRILDLTEAGRQPMTNEDGSIIIVFNGEIYNYKELRERLEHHSFESETDTEVILHLYEEEGVDCLQELRGMFAFALWDYDAERLFLARDRLGQKPLYYRMGSDSFYFGSTIRAILSDPSIEAEPDLSAIRQYISYQYVPGRKTGFKKIKRLRPAEYMVIQEGSVQRDTYWSLSYAKQLPDKPGVISSHLRDKLKKATRLRMRSDVPLGVFLSGGVDSSIVTALMSDISDTPIRTFSIGFEVSEYDELEYARTVSQEFGTDHYEHTVTPDAIEVLPKLVEEYEIPFGDPSALPTYYVSEVASNDVKVALSGDAGDENFAGYHRYSRDRILSRLSHIPQVISQSAHEGIKTLPRPIRTQEHVYKAMKALGMAETDPVKRYANLVMHETDGEMQDVWDGPAIGDPTEYLRSAFERADGPTRLDRLMHVDFLTYLPDDLLVKVDRASMAHSLEVRSPFLDHEFIRFSSAIPAKYKWKNGKRKYILKKSFDKELPSKILNRKKEGFSVPIAKWFRNELREFARENLEELSKRESFESFGLERMLEEHVSKEKDHARQIWDLVQLNIWYETFME